MSEFWICIYCKRIYFLTDIAKRGRQIFPHFNKRRIDRRHFVRQIEF